MTKNKPKVIRRPGNLGAIVVPRSRQDIAEEIAAETQIERIARGIEACCETDGGIFFSPGARDYISSVGKLSYIENQDRYELAELYATAEYSSEFCELLEAVKKDPKLRILQWDEGIRVLRRGERIPDYDPNFDPKKPFWTLKEPVIFSDGGLDACCRARLASELDGRHRDNPFQSSDRFTEGEPLSPYAFLAAAKGPHRKEFAVERFVDGTIKE